MKDNYGFFCDEEESREEWLNKCPECDICGEKIQDEYLYDIDGMIYCDECLRDKFRKWREDYENV